MFLELMATNCIISIMFEQETVLPLIIACADTSQNIKCCVMRILTDKRLFIKLAS